MEEHVSTQSLLSTAKYNMVIGLVLCWGFLVNWLMVTFMNPMAVLEVVNGWIVLILYSVSSSLGYYLFVTYNTARMSFIGYNLVVLPLGFVLSLALYDVAPTLLFFALGIAFFLTLLMMLFGYLFPSFFQKIYSVLAVALLGVVIIELFQTFVLGAPQEWIEWVVIGVFCGYIGYDWGVANQVEKTLDNAIDSAAMLYMDIIILFIRIVKIIAQIAGKKSSS